MAARCFSPPDSSAAPSVAAWAPSTLRNPESGLSSRASRCIRPDLPEPDRPTITRASPARTPRLTPFRASKREWPAP
jgi:hypothetical protein